MVFRNIVPDVRLRCTSGICFSRFVLLCSFLLLNVCSNAHPMPHSVVLLDIKQDKITGELQVPFSELELALNKKFDNPENLKNTDFAFLRAYILQHIRFKTTNGKTWQFIVDSLSTSKAEQTDTGPYKELVAEITALPPAGQSTHHFTLQYDIIIHQLVNHEAFISVRQDWENGKTGTQNDEVNVISMDTRNNTIAPLVINLDEGNNWNGFKGMLQLGMHHIAEGTDHLLFLLVLLLPAPLLYSNKKWTSFGENKYSINRLLKITIAFTIGHSITLLIASFGILTLPQQPIEILIAVSILVTAIHAVRPLVAGKEIYVAAGFGLIHGLAFADILSVLHLDKWKMALSVLGFNLGIELMQLFVIFMFVPWLIILSTSSLYKWIRIGGATLSGIAAMAWIAERVSGKSNFITQATENIAAKGKWIALVLAIVAVLNYLSENRRLTKI